VSRNRTIIVTLGIMLSLFMASMEATVIATAMPTIVSQLGGIEIYSWAFAIYMLASTTTVPIFGKLSDLYGRRLVFLVALTIFTFGSILCGLAESMPALVAGRAVQGLGAGGLLPLALTMIGDLFSFEQRAKMQGVFSGVWGVSSIIGPLIGGFLVDRVHWHWVFFINIPASILAMLLVGFGWQSSAQSRSSGRPSIDYAGAALLSIGVISLLLGLQDLASPGNWAMLGLALACFVVLVRVENRAANPMLPVYLMNDRMFAMACLQGVLIGWTLFGSVTYIPLFVQAVMGTAATTAGATLTPMLLSWVFASIIGSRLLLRFSYRSLALIGMSLVVLGTLSLALISAGTPQPLLLLMLASIGVGMGFTIPSFIIAVQSSVARKDLGTATSTLQFTRNIGGTLGVSIMGTVLAFQLGNRLIAAGLDPDAADVNAIVEGAGEGGAALPEVAGAVQVALGGAIQSAFVLVFIAAVGAWIATALAPSVRASDLAGRREHRETAETPQPADIPASAD
jgi:EmrB/QacA subfamily drug resistance transporter